MMYYPEAVTADTGGTMLVPGSHFRPCEPHGRCPLPERGLARARLWRYLTGDDEFDLDFYLTRNALRPQAVSVTATDTRVAKSARGAGFGVVEAAT